MQRTRDARFCSSMEEKEVIKSSNNNRLGQPPSVPFLWEERPGIAKKDWRPTVSSVGPVLPPPPKYVASVPFIWEEKPGTPLSCLTQPSMELANLNPPANLNALSLPLSPAQGDGNQFFGNTCSSDRGSRNKHEIFDLGLLSSQIGDSFSPAPSLMANCLIPTTEISTAVPIQKTSPTDDLNDHITTPSSPTSETDSSTSSYATGFSSLVGDSFLEYLFPIYPPHSGFLGKAAYPNEGPLTSLKLHNGDLNYEPSGNAMARRPPTLGELIMMSRRMSLQRKAFQRRKQRPSMVNL
uniref:Uncharacterized protein MANES_14G032500 n=1 Tax=Rhizophora mucronata TaxID=61149 RepID=A0A2P2JMF2_RHIMU